MLDSINIRIELSHVSFHGASLPNSKTVAAHNVKRLDLFFDAEFLNFNKNGSVRNRILRETQMGTHRLSLAGISGAAGGSVWWKVMPLLRRREWLFEFAY